MRGRDVRCDDCERAAAAVEENMVMGHDTSGGRGGDDLHTMVNCFPCWCGT